MNSVQTKKEQLKPILIEHAYAIMKKEGISAIRIRTLAEKAGCSVGTFYNIFETFDDIHYHLNSRVIKELLSYLYVELEKSAREKVPLTEALPQLGWAYLDFGKVNLHSWKTLFESTPTADCPTWYLNQIAERMEPFKELLASAYGLTREHAEKLINYFWFAIHGVSSIILNQKGTDTSDEFLEKYIDHCLRGIHDLA